MLALRVVEHLDVVEHILSAVEETTGAPVERNAKNAALVQAVAENHAKLAAELLTERSTILAGLVDEGAH